jgi:hypothetical protein
MDKRGLRLELLKVLLPMASRAGIEDPAKIIEKARTLENYVLDSDATGEETPDSPLKRGPGRPRKEKPDSDPPDFLTPPLVDKSKQIHG